MECALCKSLDEKYRVIKETKHSFCVLCARPLKKGHLLLMPKECISQNNFSEFTPEQAHDLFSLIEEMQELLKKFSEEEVILFKNSGSHSSQNHFHIHLIPSKGNLRDLVSNYEGIPRGEEVSIEHYKKVKDEIMNLLQ